MKEGGKTMGIRIVNPDAVRSPEQKIASLERKLAAAEQQREESAERLRKIEEKLGIPQEEQEG